MDWRSPRAPRAHVGHQDQVLGREAHSSQLSPAGFVSPRACRGPSQPSVDGAAGWAGPRACPGELDQHCLQERADLRETATAARTSGRGGLGIPWGRRKVVAGTHVLEEGARPSLKREGRTGRAPSSPQKKTRPGDHWGFALRAGRGSLLSPTSSLKLKQDSETAAQSYQCRSTAQTGQPTRAKALTQGHGVTMLTNHHRDYC